MDKSIDRLIDRSRELRTSDLLKGAKILKNTSDDEAVDILSRLNRHRSLELLNLLDADKKQAIIDLASPRLQKRWSLDKTYDKGTVGSIMELPIALFQADDKVKDATERLKELSKNVMVNYGFVIDEDGKLEGVFAFRELLFADPADPLKEISIMNPFHLSDTTTLSDACLIRSTGI